MAWLFLALAAVCCGGQTRPAMLWHKGDSAISSFGRSSSDSPSGGPQLVCCLHCSDVVIERVRLRQLTWGDANDLPALQQEFPAGFHTILGADVVYNAECVPDLFATAVALLAESRSARLMLCHVTRCVSEDSILATAQHAGLKHLSPPACLTREHLQSACLKEPYRLLTFALNDLPH